VGTILNSEPGVDFLVNVGDLALNLPGSGPEKVGGVLRRRALAPRGAADFRRPGRPREHRPDLVRRPAERPVFEGRAHPTYFAQDWGQVHLAFLDAFEGPAGPTGARGALLTADQIAWLDQDLSSASAAGQSLFLVSHQGAFQPQPGPSGQGGLAQVRDQVVPLMKKYGALAMFAGHDAFYERGHEGCVDYLVVGAGGAPMSPRTRALLGSSPPGKWPRTWR